MLIALPTWRNLAQDQLNDDHLKTMDGRALRPGPKEVHRLDADRNRQAGVASEVYQVEPQGQLRLDSELLRLALLHPFDRA